MRIRGLGLRFPIPSHRSATNTRTLPRSEILYSDRVNELPHHFALFSR